MTGSWKDFRNALSPEESIPGPRMSHNTGRIRMKVKNLKESMLLEKSSKNASYTCSAVMIRKKRSRTAEEELAVVIAFAAAFPTEEVFTGVLSVSASRDHFPVAASSSFSRAAIFSDSAFLAAASVAISPLLRTRLSLLEHHFQVHNIKCLFRPDKD